ncbi:MAG: GNAT family N-acetyltransferase [Firmicutes bacterium]|nr:GNAT family N-acetyltransferase [Bacillota bacterium]
MFKLLIDDHTDLRLLEIRHADDLYNLTNQSRNTLREWLFWVDFTQSPKDSMIFIESTMKQFCQNNGFQAGIWYKGELAGVIGLHAVNWTNKSTSIGYWLGEKFQGKGLMTNACDAVVEYCFNELKLNRIEIRVATENHKSLAIPNRLGFQNEGCIKSAEWLYDKYVDHNIFGLIKDDYESIKSVMKKSASY